MAGENKTAAIVVSYHPETDRLDRLFDALATQVGEIFLVDNGSSPDVVSWLFLQSLENRIQLLSLGDNFGIGFAQNRGIAFARDRGHQKFLLLDQDSLPEEGMVPKLEKALDGLMQAGTRVGAVGPTRKDENDPAPVFFLKFDRFPPSRLHCDAASQMIPVDILISSGMLIPLQAIEEVGVMDERLFIDHVETEWCLRGLTRDFRFFAVCEARIHHRLGNSVARLWIGRWRNMTIHVPLRNYYFVRNSLVLIRRDYILKQWKRYMAWTLFKFCIRNSFNSPPLTRVFMMTRGIVHAFAGRLGRL